MIFALEELKHFLLQSSQEEDVHEETTRKPIRVRGESGAQYIHRLLYVVDHYDLCREQLRLDKNVFLQLVNIMIERNLLSDGRYIKVEEQLAICLFILANGGSYRLAADTFKHSMSTISKYFRAVLKALVNLSFDVIRPHRELSEVPKEIETNSLYWPYFKDCVGALDGTHITAKISDSNCVPYRGRKGTKTWNVLGCCSLDGLFTFINVGWEGSAHDTSVWTNSIYQSKFNFPHPPPGKYYLVDSGYPNTLRYLSPIKEAGQRYHMPDFQNGRKPEGITENYKYRHSSLRTTIKRLFGQTKQTWRVLHLMPQMRTEWQVAIIVSIYTLHNLRLMHRYGIPVLNHNSNFQGSADSDVLDKERTKAMGIVRRNIAVQIAQSLGLHVPPDYQKEFVEEEENTQQEDNV